MSEFAVLLDEDAGTVRPRRVVDPTEARDIALTLLQIFEIPAVAKGDDGITFPDDMDERDGDLQHAILRLSDLRFPLRGSPRAQALASD
ncbi:hypothetical protein [Terrabacter sp. C0L_2]|uniref:hypothetical protein n=1 Tax=Terrabacter sp. C0L_2 TaxID=3108389 RepID=UPI0017F139A1|nr:hypothetical protein [Dermatophilaceae bacterium]WVM95479.1 hypothetical protein U5C87_15935 [Terrabacter sp. C0L_2]